MAVTVATRHINSHVETIAYSKEDQVLINDIMYIANETTGADYTGAFVEGWELDEWHELGKRRPSKMIRFTSNGTYTPSVGVKSFQVEMCGAGGGTPALGVVSHANHYSASSGGGSAAYAKFTVRVIPATVTVTVSGATTSNGGASVFGTYCTCIGGSVGIECDTGSSATSVTAFGGNGGSAPSVAGAEIGAAFAGAKGGMAACTSVISQGIMTSGDGGSNPLGIGGARLANVGLNSNWGTVGTASVGYGAGAGGGIEAQNGSTVAVYGRAGIVIITEFF